MKVLKRQLHSIVTISQDNISGGPELETKIPNLESARLFYTPASRSIISLEYVSWLNDPDVNKYLESSDYSIEKLTAYIEDIILNKVLFWAIHLKTDKSHLGNIKIDPISILHGTGEYGILLGKKEQWGHGFAEEASKTIIQHCFDSIKLRKICLGVVKDNLAAVHLYEKLGFCVEGLYKKHAFHDGKYCDVLRMALFNPKDDIA